MGTVTYRPEPVSRRIAGEGTPEATWQAWTFIPELPTCAVSDLAPDGRRVVVVAPHPDDELLGCGGLLARLADSGRDIVVVGVTDGEASHPDSTRLTPGELAATRCLERQRGLQALGLAGDSVRLAFPDGGVAAAEAALAQALLSVFRPADIVLTTWRLDGHPDHEAVGRACARAAHAHACTLLEMPVWMWHWARPADARVPWSRLVRLPLDDTARQKKSLAIARHASQLTPDGERDPVLPDWALARWQRPFETFFVEAP